MRRFDGRDGSLGELQGLQPRLERECVPVGGALRPLHRLVRSQRRRSGRGTTPGGGGSRGDRADGSEESVRRVGVVQTREEECCVPDSWPVNDDIEG